MSKTAFVFPGQGAQYAGMGKDFYEAFSESRRRFEEASDCLGFSMEKLCFEEPERLNQTEYTQPAMVTVCAAILDQTAKTGRKASVCAGLSLGEYSALYGCGVLGFADAVKAVRRRGMLMEHTVPSGRGAMAAILGLPAEEAERICAQTKGCVRIANDNCPGQIVISGEKEAVEEAARACRQAGARRAAYLTVSGPFHSPMLEPAAPEFAQVLAAMDFKTPQIPYVSNVTAQYVTDREKIVPLLLRQIYSPVYWRQSVIEMARHGVDTFVEIGPGRTVSSLIRKTLPEARTLHIEHVSDLAIFQEEAEC